MDKKGPDPITLLKMQDIVDILYKLNRIKDNSYDERFSRQFNNMPPIEITENILRYMTKNIDNMTKDNAEIFITILKNMESINKNKKHISRNTSNLNRNTGYDDNDIISKIKLFLKSLNDEE